MAGGGSKPGYQRGPGRKGKPNRDKAELRARVSNAVREFVDLKRAKLLDELRTTYPEDTNAELMDKLELMQPEYPDWDPVVQLGVMAADHSHRAELRRQAASDAAQYLRPKLKSIELLEDPESLDLMEEKLALGNKLAALMVHAASSRSSAVKPEKPEDDEEDF